MFAPSKEDTAVLVNTAVEFATDTILEPYNPIDSLHQRIRTVTKRKSRPVVRPNYNARLRRMNKELTTRIDSMITTYEQVVTPTCYGQRIRTARTSEPFNSYDWRDCHCRRVAVRLLPDYDLAGYHPEQSLPEGIGGGQ